MKNKYIISIIVVIVSVLLFFKPIVLQGNLPIPSDTIIGLYHPFRDLYQGQYPRGIPFKNSLITDPVRQQLPWRYLVVSLEKKFQLPLWNPYNFSGVPLLANFQTGAFYPLSIIFFIVPFEYAWTFLVVLQLLLSGLFLYLYLSYIKINKFASILGAVAFVFSGFSVSWLEWNTILQVAVWLPLILLATEHLIKKLTWKWVYVFIFAEVSAIFAGHLQLLFYTLTISNAYLIARLIQINYQEKEEIKNTIGQLWPFLIISIFVLLITSIQLLPTFQFISQSGRDIDQVGNWQKEGWFIPWQHLIQFIIPDFFGNPTTLNYWGTWNYAELTGYIGLLPLLMAIYALFFRRDNKTLFFGTLFFFSLIFSLPTFFAQVPYLLNIPFISSSQPTRLLFITDFSLAILAALGFDYFMQNKKRIIYPIILMMLFFVGLWVFVLSARSYVLADIANYLLVSKRNMILPSVLFIISISVLVFNSYAKTKRNYFLLTYCILLGIVIFDLVHFADKFTPFTPRQYLFPSTKTLTFLQKNIGNYRLMTSDSRILPPNFSIMYKLQSVDGYDPLYLMRYAELIAASERNMPSIDPPFGYNRIITPHNYDSRIIDLLGVRYVLSLSDLSSPKLKKVFQEGETRTYENTNVLPRTFFVESVEWVDNKENAIKKMFNIDLYKTAIIEKEPVLSNTAYPKELTVGQAEIVSYEPNRVVVKIDNLTDGFLILTDSYYPTWRAYIYTKEFRNPKKVRIYKTDLNFRGMFVERGQHMIEFSNQLFFNSDSF